MQDTKIVDLYLQRDETATDETAKKYGKGLITISRNIVENVQTAEECENDTYMQAWELIPPSEPRTYLFAFLARIIRNISLNRCRDEHRLKRQAYVSELSEEMEECLPSPDDTECKLEEKELAAVINVFLALLPKKKRMIFLRRYWFGDSIRTIASDFGMSQSSVKTTLFRLRKELKDKLEKEGYVL